VIQVRRYESGASQPTLDVIRRLAVALQVSADVLIFGADERGPDGDLRLQFEAISKFAPEEKKVIKALLEGMMAKALEVTIEEILGLKPSGQKNADRSRNLKNNWRRSPACRAKNNSNFSQSSKPSSTSVLNGKSSPHRF
jgi:transcriptional regulator with XRE-family HTH domain